MEIKGDRWMLGWLDGLSTPAALKCFNLFIQQVMMDKHRKVMQNIAEIVPWFSYTTLHSHSTVTSNGIELTPGDECVCIFYRGQIIYRIQLHICGHVR